MQRTGNLITIEIEGIDEVVESLSVIQKRIDTTEILSRVATSFENRLRAATPVGYSGKLPSSVLTEVDGAEIRTGYETGVETAGTKPRPRRRAGEKPSGETVLHRNKWVRPKRLVGIFWDSFEAFSGEAVSQIESGLSEEVERVVS